MDSAPLVASSHSELPLLDNVLDYVEQELKRREQVGFLSFDVLEFRNLVASHGAEVGQLLLQSLSETLNKQRGKLFRDEDLVAVGGPTVDFFVIYLFSPPRRKEAFAKSDLKLIANRVLQKLSYMMNETAARLGVESKIDLRGGYTILRYDPNVPVDKLVYGARKEAALKSELEEIMLTFVSNVSHELRTPLTCIKGYAETLLEGALSEPELAQRWMKVIHEEAFRLERLIRDLLDLSMIEAQQVEMNFHEIDLAALVRHTADVLAPHGRSRGVRIEVVLPEHNPLWRGDEDRLSQVVTNLVDNAIKYSPPEGVVTVTLSFSRDKAKIEVADCGTGIPEEELPRIFERFYRVEKGSAARFGGRGLGLSIAMHIVEAHDGELLVESRLHHGTRFIVHLPAGETGWMGEEE